MLLENTKKLLRFITSCGKIISEQEGCSFYRNADMAELADAHGSGPCERKFMEVQVLLSAPVTGRDNCFGPFLFPGRQDDDHHPGNRKN